MSDVIGDHHQICWTSCSKLVDESTWVTSDGHLLLHNYPTWSLRISGSKMLYFLKVKLSRQHTVKHIPFLVPFFPTHPCYHIWRNKMSRSCKGPIVMFLHSEPTFPKARHYWNHVTFLDRCSFKILFIVAEWELLFVWKM